MNKTITLTIFFLLSFCALSSAQDLEGSVDKNGLISLTPLNGPLDVVGVDFQSEGGFLVPTDDPSPWGIVISKTNERVTLGTLGASVVLDATLTTNVGYTGSSPETDLIANYGTGVREVRFPVIPEPSSALLSLFAIVGVLGFRRGRR